MAQFIKIGQRFINMDRVELVEPRAGGELRVNFNEGGITLGGAEAKEMMCWLGREAEDVAVYRAAVEALDMETPDGA